MDRVLEEQIKNFTALLSLHFDITGQMWILDFGKILRKFQLLSFLTSRRSLRPQTQARKDSETELRIY